MAGKIKIQPPRSDKKRPSKRKDGISIPKSKKLHSPRLRKDGIQKAVLVENRALEAKSQSTQPERSPSKRGDIKDKILKQENGKKQQKEAPLTSKLEHPRVDRQPKKLKQKIPKEKIPKSKRPK